MDYTKILKKGDIVYVKCTVHDIDRTSRFPISLQAHGTNIIHKLTITDDGRYTTDSTDPCLVLPSDLQSTERVIEVWSNGEWLRKVLVKILSNGDALCWNALGTSEQVKKSYSARRFETWREVPTEIEVTMQEIADKFGISVETLRIKKA